MKSFFAIFYNYKKHIFIFQVYPPITKPHKPQKNHKNELETSTLGLHFVVNSQHFINGRLKVKML
jgi:hypothetical protein